MTSVFLNLGCLSFLSWFILELFILLLPRWLWLRLPATSVNSCECTTALQGKRYFYLKKQIRKLRWSKVQSLVRQVWVAEAGFEPRRLGSTIVPIEFFHLQAANLSPGLFSFYCSYVLRCVERSNVNSQICKNFLPPPYFQSLVKKALLCFNFK